MKSFHFNCYKIGSELPLSILALFFNIKTQPIWKQYLIITSKQLQSILKCDVQDKYVYIFKYGCINFINFSDEETILFIKNIESMIYKINYSDLFNLHESHTLKIDDMNKCFVCEASNKKVDFNFSILSIISIVLSKSSSIYKIELEANKILDEAERLLIHLQNGTFKLKWKKLSNMTAQILKFEYYSINEIRIFERNIHGTFKIDDLKIYDELEKYYELHDRFEIIETKIQNLRRMLRHYLSLSSSNKIKIQYIFQIFLLALFPIFFIIQYFKH